MMPLFDRFKKRRRQPLDEEELRAKFDALMRQSQKLQPRDEVQAQIDKLRSPHGSVRTGAAEALAGQGKGAVPALLKAVRDPHPGVRAGAAYALGHIGDERAVEPVAGLLKDDDESVRTVAARALGRISDLRAAMPLAEALQDEAPDTRFLVAGALASMADALGDRGDTAPVPALIQALQDPDSRVRLQAAITLARIGDTRAVEPLIQRLTHREDDYQVKMVALIGLGDLGDPRAVGPLARVLEVGDGQARAAAAEALGKIGDPGAVDALIPVLGDQVPHVRCAASGALGLIGDPQASVSLEHMLHDEDAAVRAAAQEALQHIAAQPQPTGVPAPGRPEVKPGERPMRLGMMQKGEYTYERYVGGDAETARAFLDRKKPRRPNYYVIVETPDGIWGKDREGLYLVGLLPWQRDLRLAECEGSMAELPLEFAAQSAIRGESDNFVTKVQCGKCKHEWRDGLAYQETTVVRCPRCRTYNKVDTSHFVFLAAGAS